MPQHTRIVNLISVVAMLVAVLVGIGLLALSAQHEWWLKHPWAEVVIREVGSLILVTGLLSLWWERIARRAVAEEVLTRIGTNQDIARAGLVRVTDTFHRDIDWQRHFRSAHEIDVYFAYGRTWLATHIDDLRDAAERGATIRVILPDPQNDEVTRNLAHRFAMERQQIVELIQQSTENIRALASPKHNVEVWYLPETPVFSFYRFDDVAIFALYSHRHNRAAVPAFTVEAAGTLFDFVQRE
jgi:hypothetical protein